ncbi:MAG: DUF6457 domain-containing protein [Propionicimonas sp.]
MHADNPEKMAAMRHWLGAVEGELGLDPELIESVESPLLELISTVAHGPSRPGAPLTAFLIGVATGQGRDPRELIARISELASRTV